MSPWLIYLWTRLNAILWISGAGLFLGISATVILIGLWSDSRDDDFIEKCKRGVKKLIPINIISLLLLLAVPCRKDAAIIYVIPKIANSEIVKEIPEDMTEIYRTGIKELKETIQVRKEGVVENEKSDK